MTPIYFEIVRAKGGFRAHCRSRANGKLIWWTEVYKQRAGARKAIQRLKEHAGAAEVYDRTSRSGR